MRTAALVTIEEFERMAHGLGPCELVDGEIVAMSPGHFKHSRVTATVAFILETYARRSKHGRALTNEAGVVVSTERHTVRGADAAFISYKRLPAGKECRGFLRQPPELVVEVLGVDDTWPGIEKKVSDYHGFGVDVVWVADPRTLSVRVYPKRGEPYVLHEKDVIAGGKLLPGFQCRVSEFFVD
ncbi:MAG: Uma2 family endonuclease [Planctomycetota bacterium]|nr:Uma2 family endonuclease [Planctomycetota bacterium]